MAQQPLIVNTEFVPYKLSMYIFMKIHSITVRFHIRLLTQILVLMLAAYITKHKHSYSYFFLHSIHQAFLFVH